MNWLVTRGICRILLLGLASLCLSQGFAQTHRSATGVLFNQLTTSHGLSDNYIASMTIDSSGSLWIGTGDGLNLFNGKTVVRYFHNEHPELPVNQIRQVVCDQDNRIWILTAGGGLTIIDEERRFHRVAFWRDEKEVNVRRILDPGDVGIVLFIRDQHLRLGDGVDITAMDSLSFTDFEPVVIEGFDTLYSTGFRQVEKFDRQHYVFTNPDKLYVINYVTQRLEHIYDIPNMFDLAPWDEESVLMQDQTTLELVAINLATGGKSLPFAGMHDQFGSTLEVEMSNAQWINPHELLFTSRGKGIYVYNKEFNTIQNYRHNAADPTTIVNNFLNIIAYDNNGWVFLGGTPNGISYYKSDAVIGQQTVFTDDKGHSYDGHISNMTTLDNDTYYIATQEYLIRWKRSINATHFVYVDGIQDGDPSIFGAFYVTFDQFGRLWVSVRHHGIYILDQDEHVVGHLTNIASAPELPSGNSVRFMCQGKDGFMWLCSDYGVFRVDPKTLRVDLFEGTPLEALRKTYISQVWFTDEDNIWIATKNKGAWQYCLSTQEVIKHTKATGLPANEVFCFNRDRQNNIYIATVNGLYIMMHDSTSMHISMDDGLMNNRIEALLLDKNDHMWIGNDVGIACFTMADTSVRVFDERYGLSVQGFRLASYHQNSDDELIWGTERGIQYFYPERLLEQKISFPTYINRIETRDVARELTKSETFHLSPASNYVTFYFTSIDYSTHLRTFYAYQLEGIDRDWIKVADQNSVRYSSLPPGTYTFRVMASNDDRIWERATNSITLSIAKPLWSQNWFRLLGFALIVGIGWQILRAYRKKQQAQQEELETQVVINFFASRINSYRKVDELLWDVAEHCISKLHFEDCVIYLRDPVRNVLVQKAAFGPKKHIPEDDSSLEIHAPIEIPIGQGIVGTVAATGTVQLIPDTSKDPRYIIDDIRRNSELAVPINIDNTVIGVIDSEHSRKHFFTKKHMNILSTIAALCANQIQRVRAEDEKQQAMIEVLKNKQKVTESRLQSLRLQMNPHFLFNALNSIQQMILANEEMVATRYLSRFSKLLRAILIHSDKELVTLKEELDILNLYIDLESVRFKGAFQYDIICDDEIDIDEVKIPTLLIQPFVENAIWHGLMHKEGNRLLTVHFFEHDDWLHCVIRDNGIGREKARAMRIANDKNHTSKGISVSMERVKAMTSTNGKQGCIEIVDMHDEQGEAAGTHVEISLPMQN